MRGFRLTKAATDDLEEIWLYIAEDSTRNADRMLDSIYKKLTLLVEFPKMGALREEFGADVRVSPVPPFVIFYRADDRGIEVVRVLHGSRDLETLFSEDDPSAS